MIWLCSVLFAQEPTPQEAIQAFEREFAYVHTEKCSEKQPKSLVISSQTKIRDEKNSYWFWKKSWRQKNKYEQLAALYESLKRNVEKGNGKLFLEHAHPRRQS